MKIQLKQNLARVIRTLEGQGMKTTKIAQAIGYTTTTQLYSTIEGKSLLSTKAVMGLIENLNVNPSYIFLGTGDMFITEETEIDTLRRENREWIQRHNEVIKTVMEFYKMIKVLENRNADLIDISSAALKYNKGQKEGEEVKEGEDLSDLNAIALKYSNLDEWKELHVDENNPKDPLHENLEIYRRLEKMKKESTTENPDSSLKQHKK